MTNRWKNVIKQSGQTERNFEFFDMGFHGDEYLLKFVKSCMSKCNYFIETGTNVGSTLAYVAETYPKIRCFSCEPDKQAFEKARENTAQYPNTILYNETSQEFFSRLTYRYSEIFKQDVLFWLDAHGYGFTWPLKEEISYITNEFRKAYIFIDDFKIPGLDCFGYDEYKGQVCSFDYIKDSIKKGLKFSLYYPSYTDKTSKHHPLRGWGLIEFGHDNALEIPRELADKVRKVL